MHLAIKQAKKASERGEVPVGALIVHQNQVVSSAHNLTDQNPLWHAEILAIQRAQKTLKKKFLDDCSIYITLFPCPMCLHAMHLVHLKKLYIGAEAEKESRYNFEIYDGIEENICSTLLKDYFLHKRK